MNSFSYKQEAMRMNSTVNPVELQTLISRKEDIALLDVRRREDYEADPSMIPGAEWHDPEEFDEWCETVVPAGKKAVVYCLKGGALSTMVTDFLRQRKVECCYLEGGITAWKKEVLGQQNDTSTSCTSCCLTK